MNIVNICCQECIRCTQCCEVVNGAVGRAIIYIFDSMYILYRRTITNYESLLIVLIFIMNERWDELMWHIADRKCRILIVYQFKNDDIMLQLWWLYNWRSREVNMHPHPLCTFMPSQHWTYSSHNKLCCNFLACDQYLNGLAVWSQTMRGAT